MTQGYTSGDYEYDEAHQTPGGFGGAAPASPEDPVPGPAPDLPPDDGSGDYEYDLGHDWRAP